MSTSYREGDWFLVPLPTEGVAVGLIARKAPRGGVLFGYFFGPRRTNAPTMEELSELTIDSAVLLDRFGDLGLVRGEWPILGATPHWNRDLWPMPFFASRDPISGTVRRVRYSEEDPSVCTDSTLVREAEAVGLRRDGVSGADYLAATLEKLLGQSRGAKITRRDDLGPRGGVGG